MAQHRSNAPLARPRIQRGVSTPGAPVSSRDVMAAPVSYSRPQLPSLSDDDEDVTCIFDPAGSSAQRPVVPQSHPLMMNPTPPAAFRPMRPQTIAPPPVQVAPTPFNRMNAVTPPPYAPYGAFVPNANDSCPPVSLQMYADQTGSVRSVAPSTPGQTITVRPPAPAPSRAGWVYAIGTAAAVACAAVGFLAFRNGAEAPKPAAAAVAPKTEAAPLPPVVVAPPKTVDPAMAAALAAPPAINIASTPATPATPPAPEQPKVAHGGHHSAPAVAAPAPKPVPMQVAAAPKPVAAPAAPAAPKPKPEKAEKPVKNDAELAQSQKVRDAANAAIGNSL